MEEDYTFVRTELGEKNGDRREIWEKKGELY